MYKMRHIRWLVALSLAANFVLSIWIMTARNLSSVAMAAPRQQLGHVYFNVRDGVNNLYSGLTITQRSPKGYHLSQNIKHDMESVVSIPYDALHKLAYMQPQCLLNTSSSNSSVDLANLVSTLSSIIPSPEQFERGIRNPCWYMHINLPLKVNKVLRTTRGNISDSEAFNLMNLIFSSSSHHQYGGGGGGGSSRLSQDALPPKTLVCVPQVYFIGFPRSGSTQLYKMLISHPDLAGGLNKEPHWWTRHMFSSRFPHNILSIIQYLSHFREASKRIVNQTQQLLIDGSQSTVWDLRTTNNLCALPHLITNIVPSAQFIVLMRNPVDRLFSDFRYLCEEALRINNIKLHKGKGSNKTLSEREQHSTNGNLTFSVSANIFHKAVQEKIELFNKCLELGNSLDVCTHLSTMSTKSPIVDTGINSDCSRVRLGISLYHIHLARWLKVIPKERMLFLRTEDMSRDPYALLERVWHFLDVKKQHRDELNEVLHEHSHSSLIGYGNLTSGADVKMYQKTRDLLVKFFQPHNTILRELLDEERFTWTDYG